MLFGNFIRDCPNDINEAVSSLIYASARCGDLPELRTIRKLFGERYGLKFAMTALELFPGNLVNCQVAVNFFQYDMYLKGFRSDHMILAKKEKK